MTVDVFPLATSELESELFEKEDVNQEGKADEEIERESLTAEADDVENQDEVVNPMRLYLHEIGRVPLLTASNEKTIARRIEIGKRLNVVKKGLDKNTMFRQIVGNKKFRDAIDGVIDQATTLAISEKLGLIEPQPVEKRLSALSVNSAILSEVVLTAIGDTVPLSSLSQLVDDPEFIKKLVSQETELGESLDMLTKDAGAAKDHLTEANLRLVVSIAKKHVGHGMLLLDLIQEGSVGLIRGVEKFNPHRGFWVQHLRYLVDTAVNYPSYC